MSLKRSSWRRRANARQGATAAIHDFLESEVTEKGGWVYFITNRLNGTLYHGVTADLIRRIYEHREGLLEGFTKRHGLGRLVYFERHENINEAIARE